MAERKRVIPIIRRQAPSSFKKETETMQILDLIRVDSRSFKRVVSLPVFISGCRLNHKSRVR